MREEGFTMNRSKLILVGGFLGAGKTSLLWKASQLLDQQGACVFYPKK